MVLLGKVDGHFRNASIKDTNEMEVGFSSYWNYSVSNPEKLVNVIYPNTIFSLSLMQ